MSPRKKGGGGGGCPPCPRKGERGKMDAGATGISLSQLHGEKKEKEVVYYLFCARGKGGRGRGGKLGEKTGKRIREYLLRLRGEKKKKEKGGKPQRGGGRGKKWGSPVVGAHAFPHPLSTEEKKGGGGKKIFLS